MMERAEDFRARAVTVAFLGLLGLLAVSAIASWHHAKADPVLPLAIFGR